MNKIKLPLNIPLKGEHIKLIKEGKKWLALNRLKYNKYPCRKKEIRVPDELTEEIVKGERYHTKK